MADLSKLIDLTGLAHAFSKVKTLVAAKADKDLSNLAAETISKGSDLNTYTGYGIYIYSLDNSGEITNAPEEAQSTLFVLPRLTNNDSTNVMQVAFTQYNNFYVRNYVDGAWSDWRKVGIPDFCILLDDWNNAVTNGWYMGSNAANAPTTGESEPLWYFGQVIAHNENYVFQEVYQFTNSENAKEIPKYIRAKKDGTWGEWTNDTERIKALEQSVKDLQDNGGNHTHASQTLYPAAMELTPPSETANNGGFIDFHFNRSSDDYTARIIESSKGVINILATLKQNGVAVSVEGHKHAASDINSGTFDAAQIPSLDASKITSGTFSVARGGTGKSSVTSGNFLVGNGTGAMTEKTPAQVLSAIGAAASSHNQAASTITAGTFAGAVVAKDDTNYTTYQVRNAAILSATPSSMTNGRIAFVYS